MFVASESLLPAHPLVLLRIHNLNNGKTMLSTPTSNVSFGQREKTFFHCLEEELMKRIKMRDLGCYKQALLEYHARLTQSAAIR